MSLKGMWQAVRECVIMFVCACLYGYVTVHVCVGDSGWPPRPGTTIPFLSSQI